MPYSYFLSVVSICEIINVEDILPLGFIGQVVDQEKDNIPIPTHNIFRSELHRLGPGTQCPDPERRLAFCLVTRFLIRSEGKRIYRKVGCIF